MRKIALIAGMLIASYGCAFAMPDRTGKTDVGFQIGGLLQGTEKLDSALYLGGSAAYGVNEWFAVGLEGGYSDQSTSIPLSGTEQQGKIGRIPLFLDLILRYTKMPDVNYVPYGVLGLGALFTDVHGTGTFQSSNLKLDVDNSFAIKMGAGVDWFINEKWALGLEASYVWVDSDANVISLSNGRTIDSTNLDYWTLTGGVKYLFD